MKATETGGTHRESITPDTKVGHLLDHFPQLEAVLLAASPAFAKLQNPVLRRTVAKVTTLRHAARVGGVDLADLINRLRTAAGQAADFSAEDIRDEHETGPPAWYHKDRVAGTLDVRPLIEAGEKPVGAVMGALGRLAPGQIFTVTAGFVPAPLIDMARQRGFRAWTETSPDGVVTVHFCAPPDNPGGDALVDLA